MSENDAIVFGGSKMTAEQEDAYRQKIRSAAKGVDAYKTNDSVGSVPRPPPVQRPAEKKQSILSPQTQSQLAGLQKAQEEARTAEEPMKQAVEENKEDILDLFDFNSASEAERVFNNRKRRSDIEGRCKPIPVEDLLFKDEAQQLVPIIPGKFEVVFRTPRESESLFLKQFLAKAEEKSPSEMHFVEKYSLCQLCCALVSINGVDLPSHLDPKTRKPTEELFRVKLAQLADKNAYVMADLGVNYLWFDLRVRRALVNAAENLGNT